MSGKPGNRDRPQRKKRSGSDVRQRDCIIKLRAKPEERAEMRAHASAAGLSLGSFIRSLSLTHPRTRAMRRPSPDTRLMAQLMAQVGRIGGNLAQFLKLANRGEIILDRHELDDAIREARAFIALARKALGV